MTQRRKPRLLLSLQRSIIHRCSYSNHHHRQHIRLLLQSLRSAQKKTHQRSGLCVLRRLTRLRCEPVKRKHYRSYSRISVGNVLVVSSERVVSSLNIDNKKLSNVAESFFVFHITLSIIPTYERKNEYRYDNSCTEQTQWTERFDNNCFSHDEIAVEEDSGG